MTNKHPTQPPPGPDNQSALSRQDAAHLAQLERKLQVLRDRTAGVAKGYQTGCIVTGRGGTSKSYTTVEELERHDAPFKLTNSHVTPRALFDLLGEHPDAIHVIEDAEEITRDRTSLGVLRSALWGSRHDRQGRTVRLITWNTHRATLEVFFGGGIILVTNRGLSDLPKVKALATRVPGIEIHVSDREIAALMRHVASNGYQHGDLVLDAIQCMEVANFIVQESARLNRSLDMRLLINAFADRLQAEDLDSGCSWQDLVYSTLCGRPSVQNDIEPVGLRAQNKNRELKIAREIAGLDPTTRLKFWKEKTGKSQATMFRRLAELGRVDALDFDH